MDTTWVFCKRSNIDLCIYLCYNFLISLFFIFMEYSQILPLLATCCGSVVLVPEVYKAIKSRHLRDVAWGMLVLFLICSFSWFLYGFLSHNVPLMISSGINFCMETTLMNLKFKYEKGENTRVAVKKVIQTVS